MGGAPGSNVAECRRLGGAGNDRVDVRVSAIGGTLLLEVSCGALGANGATRLREHIDRAGDGDRRSSST